MSTQLQEQINNSELTPEDKEDFLFFLENILPEELEQIEELLNTRPSELISFWTSLKEKLFFMESLDADSDFSDEAKADIKRQVSEMSPDEFNILIKTIEKMTDGTDATQKMNSLLKQSKEADEKLSSLTEELISE